MKAHRRLVRITVTAVMVIGVLLASSTAASAQGRSPAGAWVGLPATAATMWVLGAGPAHASPDWDSSTIEVSSMGPDTHTGIYLGEGHTVFVEVVGGKWNMNAKDPNSPWAGPVGYAPNAPGREACRQIPGNNFAALEGMVDRPGDNDQTFAVGKGGAFTPYKNGKGRACLFSERYIK